MHVTSSVNAAAGDRLSLRILQLGAFAIVLVATPYKAFDLDRYFVPKELALLVFATAAALVAARRLTRLTLTTVDLALVLFLVTGFASAMPATNPWAAERALAISAAGAALFWSAGSVRNAGLARPLLAAVAGAVVVGAITSLAQAYGVRTEYFSLNRAPGGTFGNRNFVAHLCAIGAPVIVFVTLTAKRRIGFVAGVVGAILVAAALAMSRSRAAWLAVVVSAVVVAAAAMLSGGRWRGALTTKRLTSLGIGAAIGVVAAMVLPNNLEWKSGTPYLDSAIGLVNYKQGSGAGRLVQYEKSLRMTEAQPFLGVGPGNWPVVYPKYASRGDPSLSQEEGTTSNPWPSSDWIAYLSERGVIGLAALIVVLLGLARRAVKDVRSPLPSPEVPDSERTLLSLALLGTLTAAAIVGSFDAATIIAIPAYFVWTLAGALAPPSDRTVVARPWIRRVAPAATAVCGFFGVVRSAAQLAAIATFSSSAKIGAMERAARLDPGSYRIHVKLAEAYVARGECAHARPEARIARGLLPNAAEPKHLLGECGSR